MSAAPDIDTLAAESPRALTSAAAAIRGVSRWRLTRDRVLLLLVLLLLWEGAARYWDIALWISQPSLIAARIIDLAQSGDLARHVGRTVSEASLGLLLAFAVGLPLGLLMARYKYGNAVAEPFILGLYSLPRVALAPLFIIWFGIDLFSKVMMAFSMVLFVFMLTVHEGLKTIDRDLVDLFRTMRAPRWYVTRKVLLPWIVPWIIAALRIGVGLALIGAVVSELVGASAGLGWYIERSSGQLDTTGAFTGIVVLMALAMVANQIVAWIEARFANWR